MIDFLQRLILFFDRYNIQYMLSGSVAMSIYTIPRNTKNFDFNHWGSLLKLDTFGLIK